MNPPKNKQGTAGLRLGICDTIPADFSLPGDPGEPEKFIAMFEDIAAPFTYETYRVTEGHFPESKSECDAYLITGSPCGVHDGYAWIAELRTFVREVFAVGQPIVGVCFGHQLIAQSLGGHVERAKDGWLLGLHEIEVSARKAWMNSGSAALPLYFINQDQVVELPPDSEHLARSASCPNVMYTIGEHVLSLQAHPEQPLEAMHYYSRKLLTDNELDSDKYEAAVDSMAKGSPDGVQAAHWITEFLLTACGR